MTRRSHGAWVVGAAALAVAAEVALMFAVHGTGVDGTSASASRCRTAFTSR